MELLYRFNGIKLIDGEMPRALVDARFALNDIRDELATLIVTISLPLNRYDESLEQTAARVLDTARRLLNESEAIHWMEEQPRGVLPPLCLPADATTRIAEGNVPTPV